MQECQKKSGTGLTPTWKKRGFKGPVLVDSENLAWVSIEISFLLEKGGLVVWESLVPLMSWDCCGPSLGAGRVCALPQPK